MDEEKVLGDNYYNKDKLLIKYDRLWNQGNVRKESVISISTITIFIAGFAINDLSQFETPKHVNYQWLTSIYLFLMIFTVLITFLCSILGTTIAFTISSIQGHDYSWKHKWQKGDKESIISTGTYKRFSKISGLDDKLTYHDRELEPGLFIPMSYHFMMKSCDFAHWKFQLSRYRIMRGQIYCKLILLLPFSIFSYFIALIIKLGINIDVHYSIIIIMSIIIIISSSIMIYHTNKYLRIALF